MLHLRISADNVELPCTRRRSRRRDAPGHDEDAVVWGEIAAKTGEQAVLTGTYLVLIMVATVIAGIW